MLSLSLRKKIILAIFLSVTGFAALGALILPALSRLSSTVGQADDFTQVAVAVSEAQIAALALADDMRRIGQFEVAPFGQRVEERISNLQSVMDDASATLGDREITALLSGSSKTLGRLGVGMSRWAPSSATVWVSRRMEVCGVGSHWPGTLWTSNWNSSPSSETRSTAPGTARKISS